YVETEGHVGLLVAPYAKIGGERVGRCRDPALLDGEISQNHLTGPVNQIERGPREVIVIAFIRKGVYAGKAAAFGGNLLGEGMTGTQLVRWRALGCPLCTARCIDIDVLNNATEQQHRRGLNEILSHQSPPSTQHAAALQVRLRG